MAKATQAELSVRLEQVTELLLDGHSRTHIQRASAEAWGLSTRQIDEYIRLATEEIEEINQASIEKHLALITRNLWSIYRSTRATEPSTARMALMDIAKLRGLDKTELTLKVIRKHKDATDDELAKAIGGA